MSIYVAARAIFESWCDDPSNIDASPIDRAQCDLAAWQARNFDQAGDLRMVVGVAEEAGELAMARDPAMVRDGLGDLLVYLGQLLVANRLALWPLLDELPPRAAREHAVEWLLVRVGTLSHAVLKGDQRIRGLADPEAYRYALIESARHVVLAAAAVAHPHAPDGLGAVYVETAAVVLARDWRRDPAAGRPPLTEPPAC